MKVKILNRERLLDDFFKVDVATLQYEKFNGGWSEPVRRFNLERGEAVAVLIYLEDIDRFVIIRQFRYAAFQRGESGWIDEIVAGVIDPGEEPVESARRECIEETGYEIERFEHIATAFSSPGITTERVYIYIGYCTSEDKNYSGGGLDEEHEDIEIVELSREDACRKLLNKEFMDGKTILALQHFFMIHPELRVQ